MKILTLEKIRKSKMKNSENSGKVKMTKTTIGLKPRIEAELGDQAMLKFLDKGGCKTPSRNHKKKFSLKQNNLKDLTSCDSPSRGENVEMESRLVYSTKLSTKEENLKHRRCQTREKSKISRNIEAKKIFFETYMERGQKLTNSVGQCTQTLSMTSLFTLFAQETSAANRRADNIHCKDSPATGQGWREVIGQGETERGGGRGAQPMGEQLARASKAWERS